MVLREYYLNVNGNRRKLSNGLYYKQYTYNDNRQLIKIEQMNQENVGVYVNDIPPILEMEYDEYGNEIEERYYEANNSLIVGIDGAIVQKI